MKIPEHFESDVLFFFDGKPRELALFGELFGLMEQAFPEASVKVQKTQISFYGRHLFAAASLPLRRRRDWPKECLLVTFGLGYRKCSPRIAVATEPYPGRWTHHVVISDLSLPDDELTGWLREAWDFAESKR